MDHIALSPYPFPDGVTIPRLMPFQEYPWNGDGYLAAEVLRLKEAHGLLMALETGTCLGSTTLWLAENFDGVNSFEIVPQYHAIALARLGNCEYSTLFLEPGVPFLGRMNGNWCKAFRPFIFLDAHWGPNCPLLDELSAIAQAGAKPVIVIHDFQVPGTDFGFDRFPDSGYPFSLEAIAGHLDKIYGEGGWGHRYPTKVEGAKRGWISIFPA